MTPKRSGDEFTLFRNTRILDIFAQSVRKPALIQIGRFGEVIYGTEIFKFGSKGKKIDWDKVLYELGGETPGTIGFKLKKICELIRTGNVAKCYGYWRGVGYKHKKDQKESYFVREFRKEYWRFPEHERIYLGFYSLHHGTIKAAIKRVLSYPEFRCFREYSKIADEIDARLLAEGKVIFSSHTFFDIDLNTLKPNDIASTVEQLKSVILRTDKEISSYLSANESKQ